MAKDHSVKDTLIMCRLTISIAVQCEDNKHIIDKIQSLSDTNQHYLMKAIEQVREPGPLVYLYLRRSCTVGHGQSSGVRRHPRCVNDDRVHIPNSPIVNSRLTSSLASDDHYYHLQSDRSRVLSEKETLEKVYQNLLEEHRTLQTNYDDAISEKEDALVRMQQTQREADDNRRDKADHAMRAEIDRLRGEL